MTDPAPKPPASGVSTEASVTEIKADDRPQPRASLEKGPPASNLRLQPAKDSKKLVKEPSDDSKHGKNEKPEDFMIEAYPDGGNPPFGEDQDDRENLWGDPADFNVDDELAEEDKKTQEWEVDDDPVFRRVLRESARAAHLKEYQWSEWIREVANIPTSFQDLKPMSSKERRELLKDTPENFHREFPCTGVRNMGEDRRRVRLFSELWFLEKGAPKIHDMLVEELRVLTFFAQECSEVKEKIGLQEQELFGVLRNIITLHVDTLKMLSAMQVQRALIATNRQAATRETDPKHQIISTAVREAELKKAEADIAYELGSGRSLVTLGRSLTRTKPGAFGRGSNRRPRFSRGSVIRQFSSNAGRPSQQHFSRTRGRGRGRGTRGRGRARSSQA